jgi:hypothetical protein
MDRTWITLSVSAGAFSVSLLSIYLGYLLFLAGATGAFKFSARAAGGEVGLESIAPGSLLIFFGSAVAIYTIRRLVG